MMYISLDMDNMKIVHKHESLNAVCGLVHIEFHDVAACIGSIDMVVINRTDLDIKLLFKSCFPNQDNHIPIPQMKDLILQFAREFPVTDLDEIEVLRQAESIRDNDKTPYKYVKGSFRACRPAAIFKENLVSTVPTVPAKGFKSPAGQNNAPKQASMPARTGGVRAKIWETADSLWEKAGKPTERNKILLLRREIMVVLDHNGVKRTSSSNELGNWQKARIN